MRDSTHGRAAPVAIPHYTKGGCWDGKGSGSCKELRYKGINQNPELGLPTRSHMGRKGCGQEEVGPARSSLRRIKGLAGTGGGGQLPSVCNPARMFQGGRGLVRRWPGTGPGTCRWRTRAKERESPPRMS